MARLQQTKTVILDEKAAGMALAGTIGSIYLVCALAVYVLLEQVFGLGRLMFHGVQIEMQPLLPVNVLIGLAGWLAVGFAGGVLFAKLYNKAVA